MTIHSLAIALIIVAGVSLAEEAAPSNQQKDLPLRLWAQKRDVQFGVAIDAAPLRQDLRYREIAGREFSMLTAADAMKMEPLRPARDQF
ncbi:MAG: endo-1,4-beta-xylanase, partial [Verrucomicrobiales bacterium]